ncbi:MAG: hypothetical protein AABX54_05765 [Nanoarchaeota archaeon]
MDIQKIRRDFFESAKKNKLCLLLFFLSLFLFIYMHFINLSWDFSAYALNSRYLFYGGTYFETLRPPMVSILLAPFLIFGTIGEYLFIIFVSILFLYSSIKLSDAIFEKYAEKGKTNIYFLRFVFYFFSLSIYSMYYSFFAGSELLALAFFELFLASLLKNKISGFYFGLAFLTRYNFLIFFPLLFFNKDYRKIIKNFLLFFIVVFPWFLFNYLKYGNWFTSIIDSYANNIFLRSYLYMPFKFSEIFSVIGYFLIFFIIGLVFAFYLIAASKKNWFSINITNILFMIIFLVIILDYSNIPLKDIRYLFNLCLPVAYFSALGMFFLLGLNKSKSNFIYLRKIVIIIMVIAFLFNFCFTFYIINKLNNLDNKFYSAAKDIKEMGVDNCEILSPAWILVGYFTENVYPLGVNSVRESLGLGKIILIFKGDVTLDDIYKIEELIPNKKLMETDDYVFYAKKGFLAEDCAKKYVFDAPYVREHCTIISSKFKNFNLKEYVLKICRMINNEE